MNTLRFLHHFFQFNQKTRLALWGERQPRESDAQRIYQEGSLPRRALRSGNRLTYREAVNEFLRMEAWGEKIRLRVIEAIEFPESIRANIPPERLPPLLYLRGKGLPAENECVSIVGTRHPSELGRDASANFASFCGVQNLKVVSGLAKGVDAIAHRENLRLGTVAILGGGVDEIYPAENSGLALEILERGGTLASPFPLNQVPLPANFPQRNEFIAALSAGTIVVEGNETSGAAVTGKLALSMGKCVATLTQDYRSGFGKGAISLQQAGAVLVCTELEALQAIFQRLGGFACPLPGESRPKARTFSFREFLDASNNETGRALVLLEEGISCGRIEKIGLDKYRLRRESRPDAKR